MRACLAHVPSDVCVCYVCACVRVCVCVCVCVCCSDSLCPGSLVNARRTIAPSESPWACAHVVQAVPSTEDYLVSLSASRDACAQAVAACSVLPGGVGPGRASPSNLERVPVNTSAPVRASPPDAASASVAVSGARAPVSALDPWAEARRIAVAAGSAGLAEAAAALARRAVEPSTSRKYEGVLRPLRDFMLARGMPAPPPFPESAVVLYLASLSARDRAAPAYDAVLARRKAAPAF